MTYMWLPDSMKYLASACACAGAGAAKNAQLRQQDRAALWCLHSGGLSCAGPGIHGGAPLSSQLPTLSSLRPHLAKTSSSLNYACESNFLIHRMPLQAAACSVDSMRLLQQCAASSEHSLQNSPFNRNSALQGGDLSEAMSNDKGGRLRWHGRGQYIALDVVRGLAYLHACKVSPLTHCLVMSYNVRALLSSHTTSHCLSTIVVSPSGSSGTCPC